MAANMKEQKLEMTADVVRQCPGLAIDVGGSVAKIIFRDKDDWEALQKNKDAKTGTLRLLSVTRTELDAAIAVVNARAHITRNADGSPTEIFTCGVGCHQFAQRINKRLNVKLTNVLETDCFINAFKHLMKNHSFKTLIKPVFQDVLDAIQEQAAKMAEMIKKFEGMSAMKMELQEKEKEEEKEEAGAVDYYASDEPVMEVLGDKMFPCMLAMLGSGFGYMQVSSTEDGSYQINDGSTRGGRTLLGLGSLLINAKSYDEIIDLAEKGNPFVVSTSQKGFQIECAPEPGESSAEGGTDVYSAFLEDDEGSEESVFSFGNAVGKNIGDFRREDLAAALVEMCVGDLVQTLLNACEKGEVKRAFLAGGFYSRDFVRRRITRLWENVSMQKSQFIPGYSRVQLHFLDQGQHLGALGALINNVFNFIGKDGKVAKPAADDATDAKPANDATDAKPAEATENVKV